MKGIRSATAIAALIVAGLSSAGAQTPTRFIRNLQAGKAQVLVGFGTSLTAGGAWLQLTRTYLQDKYPGLATVYNEGASGHSSKYALGIIHNVTRHKPDLAIIEFAMNDAYYPEQNGYTEGVPPDTSKINLGIIVDSIKAVNPACEIIVQTMDVPIGIHRQRRPNILAYYQGYRDMAKAKGWALIDHEPRWASLLAFDTSAYVAWLPDSLHPNAEGSGAVTFPAVMAALTGASVSLDAPAAGNYPSGGTLTLKATATGGTTVAFFDVKDRIGADSAAPFSSAWKPSTGKHLIMAKLMDGATPIAISSLPAIAVTPGSGIARGGAPALRNMNVTHGKGRRADFWLGRRVRASP